MSSLAGKLSGAKALKGVSTLNKKLEAMLSAQTRGAGGRFGKTLNVIVGFTAPYAVYQHEILWYNHPRGGQAKFLEQPANEMRPVMAATIKSLMTTKTDIGPALIAAATLLKLRAVALAPIKTGALKKSAFVATS